MATFNPGASSSNPQSYLGYSQGPGSASGALLEGTGQAIVAGYGLADQRNIKDITDTTRQQVAQVQDLWGVSDAVTQQTSPVPFDVQNAQTNLNRIQQGYVNGTLKDSYYYAQLQNIVQGLRSRYPTYTDQIDNIVQGITGVTPANALVSSLQNEASAAASASSQQDNFERSWISSNQDWIEIAHPGYFEADEASKPSFNQLQGEVARSQAVYQGYNNQMTRLQAANATNQATHQDLLNTNRDLATYFSNSMFDITNTSGSAPGASIMTELSNAMTTGEPMTPEETTQISQQLNSMKLTYNDSVISFLSAQPFDIEHPEKGSLWSNMTQDEQTQTIASGGARIDNLIQAFGSSDWNYVAADALFVKAQEDATTRSLLTQYPFLSNINAVKTFVGDSAISSYLSSKMAGQLINVVDGVVAAATGNAVTPPPAPSGASTPIMAPSATPRAPVSGVIPSVGGVPGIVGPNNLLAPPPATASNPDSSINDDITSITSTNIPGANQAPKELVDLSLQMINDTDSQYGQAAVERLFVNDGGLDLTQFSEDQRASIYASIFTPETTQRLMDLTEGNTHLRNSVITWAANNFVDITRIATNTLKQGNINSLLVGPTGGVINNPAETPQYDANGNIRSQTNYVGQPTLILQFNSQTQQLEAIPNIQGGALASVQQAQIAGLLPALNTINLGFSVMTNLFSADNANNGTVGDTLLPAISSGLGIDIPIVTDPWSLLQNEGKPASETPNILDDNPSDLGGELDPADASPAEFDATNLPNLNTADYANYMTGTPDLSKIVTVDTAGGVLHVNQQAAPAFQGFLAGLKALGAPIGGVGSYNNRNIAGSDRLSQHAYGNAIDIGSQTARDTVSPAFRSWYQANRESVRQLEARYGIVDGADFSSPDLGHFEYNATLAQAFQKPGEGEQQPPLPNARGLPTAVTTGQPNAPVRQIYPPTQLDNNTGPRILPQNTPLDPSNAHPAELDTTSNVNQLNTPATTTNNSTVQPTNPDHEIKQLTDEQFQAINSSDPNVKIQALQNIPIGSVVQYTNPQTHEVLLYVRTPNGIELLQLPNLH